MARFALSASNLLAARARTAATALRALRRGGSPPGGGCSCLARRADASCAAAFMSPTWMRPGAVMTAPLWLRWCAFTALRARAWSGPEGGFALRPGAFRRSELGRDDERSDVASGAALGVG